MNLELAPYKHWLFNSSLDSGNMHCFILEIDGKRGWRLPTNDEGTALIRLVEDQPEIPKDLQEFARYWVDDDIWGFWTSDDYNDNSWVHDEDVFTVIPVRDLDA